MKEELVKYETALLAKKKDFDWDVYDGYDTRTGKICYTLKEEWREGCPINIEYDVFVSAPTQSLLQRWLREIHKIHIWVQLNTLTAETTNLLFEVVIYKPSLTNTTDITYCYYSSYEEALEQGLIHALKLVT